MAKGGSILHKHLLTAKKNAKYTSNTVQNEIMHDETTDRHFNQEILSVSTRYVDLTPQTHLRMFY